MNSKSLQEHAKRVALEMPFTEQCWPFGPEFDVFKVGGKIFMIVAVAHGRPRFMSRRGAPRATGGHLVSSKTMRRPEDARTQSTFKEET